jgi:hypothetical protein
MSLIAADAAGCADFGSAARILACLWVLCRHRHKFHYADVRIMPILVVSSLVAGVAGLPKSA